MDSSKVKIVKNTIALFIRMGMIVIVSLYTSRVVLHQLGSSDFGVYNVVGGVVVMIAFMNGSLSQGVQRFLNFYLGRGDREKANKVFSSSFVIQLIFLCILFIVGESVGHWLIHDFLNIPIARVDAAFWVYQFSLISLMVAMLQVPYMALIISHEDMKVYAYISILEASLKLGIVYLLSVSPFDKLISYSVLMLMVTLVINGTYIIYSRRKYGESKFVLNRDFKIYKSLLTFSGWNILGTTSNMMTVQGINVVINLFFGTVVNAARGIAVQVTAQLDNMINNVQVAMNPQIVQLYSRGAMEKMRNLLINNFKWNFFLFWLLALPLYLKIDYVLTLWLGDYPAYTAIFIRIAVVRCLLKCIERPMISSLFAIGKMKYPNIISSTAMILSLVIAYILFKISYPPYWAFLLDLFAILANIIYSMMFLSKYQIFDYNLFFKRVFQPLLSIMVLSVVLCYGISTCLKDDFWSFIILIFSTLLISGILIYTIGLTQSNRIMVKSKIRSIIKK